MLSVSSYPHGCPNTGCFRIRVALLVIEKDVRYVFLSDNPFPAQRNILHVKILQRKRFQSAGKMVAKLVHVVVEKSEALVFEVKTYAIRTPCQKGIRCFCHIIFHDCFFLFQKSDTKIGLFPEQSKTFPENDKGRTPPFG